MYYQNVLDEFVNICTEVIAEKLTGVYLHGSMAMGCFNPEKSDIDLLVIINANMSDVQKKQFMNRVVKLNESAPKKGLEMSIIKAEYCNPFVYPTPYELHFSPMHLSWFHENPDDYIKNMNGTDKDLAAHVTVTNSYGIVLYGKFIKDVFGVVPKQDYIDSIYCDIENAKEDILDDGVYMVLNLCRVLAYLRSGLCLSKEKGGEWGLKNVPDKYHFVIEYALNCYRTNCECDMDKAQAEDYAQYMLEQIDNDIENSIN